MREDDIPPEPPEDEPPQDASTATGLDLAAKINMLFDRLQDDDGASHSNDVVAEAITSTGTKISTSYLWLLRTGRRRNPGKQHLEAIATYFKVPPGYFFDERIGEEIRAELDLLAAMRKAGVRELALRAADLSPDSVRAISAMVEQARRLERLEPGESPHADRRRPQPGSGS